MKYFFNLLKNIDIYLLGCIIFFAGISLIMISSTASQGHFVFDSFVKKQAISYFLGFLLAIAILFINYKSIIPFDKYIYVLSILLLLTVYVPGLGIEKYGARSWIDLKFMWFQPSEIVKISFIIIMAIYFSKHHESLKTFKGLLASCLYASPFILIVLKEDLGNAIVLCSIWISMIFYAGIDYKILRRSFILFVLSLPIAYRFMAGYQKERIDAFLHPDNLSLVGNFHVYHSKIAIGSGGFWGKGLFQGVQKELKFVPVQKSDFIFSVIGEELGMIGGSLLIILYCFFIFRIGKIASNAKDNFSSLIIIGFVGMFSFQIFENIAMNMGIMPVTGITLPFISYGGSSVLANMIGFGLILSIGIRSKTINF